MSFCHCHFTSCRPSLQKNFSFFSDKNKIKLFKIFLQTSSNRWKKSRLNSKLIMMSHCCWLNSWCYKWQVQSNTQKNKTYFEMMVIFFNVHSLYRLDWNSSHTHIDTVIWLWMIYFGRNRFECFVLFDSISFFFGLTMKNIRTVYKFFFLLFCVGIQFYQTYDMCMLIIKIQHIWW